MLYLAALVILTVSFYIWLSKTLNKRVLKIKYELDKLKPEFEKAFQENSILNEKNRSLQNIAEGTIALYDVTKDICKSLEVDKIFLFLKERLSRYIHTQDCLYLPKDADLSGLANYTVFPLVVNRNCVGFLAASGVADADNDKFQILSQQFLLGIGRSLLYKTVQELSITDSLTQVYSRRYFLEKLDEEISRSRKFNLSFSFLMVDIDHFKEFNDSYGHLVGDAILREVTRVIKDSIRQVDFIGRYGGEEISVILTETDKKEALFVAERIRKAIESKQISAYDESLKVTISIGISVFPFDAKGNLELIDRADLALYQAKHSGRNRVCVYS